MVAGENYYRSESADGCTIITLLPELNDKQWADIEKVGTEIVDRLGAIPSPRLVVDLTSLTYMGSAMVALIVRLYKTVNSRNGQMVVINTNPMVFEVLKLAGLTKLWTIVDGREKGFAALGVRVRSGAVGGPSPGGGNAALIGGIIGTIGAVVGLALLSSHSGIVPDKFARLIEFAFAALGIIAGTMIAVNQSGARRNLGIALLAICLLVVLGGIYVEAPAAAKTNAADKQSSIIKDEEADVAAETKNVENGSKTASESSAPAKKSTKKRKDK